VSERDIKSDSGDRRMTSTAQRWTAEFDPQRSNTSRPHVVPLQFHAHAADDGPEQLTAALRRLTDEVERGSVRVRIDENLRVGDPAVGAGVLTHLKLDRGLVASIQWHAGMANSFMAWGINNARPRLILTADQDGVGLTLAPPTPPPSDGDA
jgi:hypothetical protein